MPAAEFSIAFSEKTKPKRNKDIPLPFLTSEERTCAASRNQILAWFSSSICCFCPSVVHWARCPALKETKVAKAQLCFHPQPLTARTSCQDPATAEMRCWRSVTLTLVSSFYWFLGSDWVNSHFLHQGSSAMAIPHFASWEFSLSVSRILMTWMSTFCSLTEVVKEPPGKKTLQREEPSCTKRNVLFQEISIHAVLVLQPGTSLQCKGTPWPTDSEGTRLNPAGSAGKLTFTCKENLEAVTTAEGSTSGTREVSRPSSGWDQTGHSTNQTGTALNQHNFCKGEGKRHWFLNHQNWAEQFSWGKSIENTRSMQRNTRTMSAEKLNIKINGSQSSSRSALFLLPE